MTTIKVTPEQLLSVSRQFEAAQHQVFQMNSILKQHLFEIERQWDGSTKEKFYYDFIVAQKVMDNFVSLSLSIAKELQGHAEKFRLADQQALQSYDPSCAAPPPDECRAPAADTRNAFQKSADSLVELGQAFIQSADDRYQKRYDSVGGFLDYWTFGIPSGLVQGYVDRADKAFNSPNDTANWLTFGIHGTIREATFPTNAWSSEHWANMIGMGGLMVGGGYASSMIKPHNLLTSTGGGARINSFSRPGTGNITGGFNGFQDQRLRVTENIAKSKKARESSKFSGFVEKEISKGTGETRTPKYVPKDASGNIMPLPRTDGKMINGTVHVPESMNPHTQIGWQKGRKGDYIQTLEWGENGVPVKRTDWTDHGRPQNHTNPHDHPSVFQDGSWSFK
ncbi:WXG100 family type VII secretion target [Paenibacillus sp. QZ-Y1]|uniref:WXG100 family type VII secretion target n=1 Tax=Paenibacillus sp. QZ-Y1 TaxID=3414511 RepID=UPI003F7A3896